MIKQLILRFLLLGLLSCQIFALQTWKEGNNNSRFSYGNGCDVQPSGNNQAYLSIGMHIRNNVTNQVVQIYKFAQLAFALEKVKSHIYGIVLPQIINVTSANYRVVIPEYLHDKGLRGLFLLDPTQFAEHEQVGIIFLNNRIESYVTRIEDILLDKSGQFCEQPSLKNRIKLSVIYADFLKEFNSANAQNMFKDLAQTNAAFESARSQINWKSLHLNDAYNNWPKRTEAITVGTCRGLLARVYKAIEAGNFELASQLGNEKFFVKHTILRGDTHSTVFDKYPQLRTQVENDARKQADQIARELSSVEIVNEKLHDQCIDHNTQEEWQLFPDVMPQRIDDFEAISIDDKVFEQKHDTSVVANEFIVTQFLTADRLGISLFGNKLQHTLLDESITIIDMFGELKYSGDFCKELDSFGDVLVGFTNASIGFNKAGDVVKTTDIVNASWMMLNCLDTMVDFTQKSANAIYGNIAVPAMRVLGKKLENTVHVVTHPIQTGKEVLNAFGICMQYVGKVAASTAIDYAKIDRLLNETSYLDPHRVEELHTAFNNYEPAIITIGEGLYNFPWKETAANISVPDVVEGAVSFAADYALCHWITKFFSIAASGVVTVVKDVRDGRRALQTATQASEILMTVEGIPVRVAASELAATEVAECMSTGQKVGGSAKKVGEVAKTAAVETTAKSAVLKPRALKALEVFDIAKYDPAIGDLSILEKAVEKFTYTTGAMEKDGPLLKALECGLKSTPDKVIRAETLSTARGALYELEKALELEAKGEKIIELGKSFGSRDFDIVLDHKLIECKNIDWATRVEKAKTTMQSTLGQQKKIATDMGKIFELHSKNPIPKDWADWFIKNGITFVEDIAI